MIKKITYIVLALALAVSIYMNFKLQSKIKTLAFVDTAYLFNNFKMKQELETDFEQNKKLKQQQLDSLYDKINYLRTLKNEESTKALENEYLVKRKLIIEEQERLQASFNNQIWNQLNGFVKKYGEENKIDLILGASGEGNIMHGNDNMNISKEIIDYANKNYAGK